MTPEPVDFGSEHGQRVEDRAERDRSGLREVVEREFDARIACPECGCRFVPRVHLRQGLPKLFAELVLDGSDEGSVTRSV